MSATCNPLDDTIGIDVNPCCGLMVVQVEDQPLLWPAVAWQSGDVTPA